ncbi:MAG: alpha-amylase [bacterium]|nr:alpha-amylase [bacterium]
MTFSESMLKNDRDRPESVRNGFTLPRRQEYFPSPIDWRDEVLYFLLVDRFSDGGENGRDLLDRDNLANARPPSGNGEPWSWDLWVKSGGDRWQGGTIQGVISKLDYLKDLGVSTIWLSPVFKQRGHLDTYHGYGIQDFLDVDPRFGTRQDLVDLVQAVHDKGLRIILDIIFNHSGYNWVYPPGTPGGQEQAGYTTGNHPFGSWLGEDGRFVDSIVQKGDGVYPLELQDTGNYTRAGSGNLGAGFSHDPCAEHKRTDFCNLRDFNLDKPGVLNYLARCYKYWIALTDCDGFRMDTMKHVAHEHGRNFCGTIKEFAANLGKKDFFLVGEMAGGDDVQAQYLNTISRNMNAALDIGNMRVNLNQVAKGLAAPDSYFNGFHLNDDKSMGSHRSLGKRHVSILDDHDHVFGAKIRFASEAASPCQAAAGVALQFFSLGIPCVYYGTEQGFSGPEESERKWLPGWKGSEDRYLREAMFGPRFPRKQGLDGLSGTPQGLDENLPGFGPFGTAGYHCFDPGNDLYRRISEMAQLRKEVPALRYGRQYLRQTSFFTLPFGFYGPGEIAAWSRILDDEEALCILNSHGAEKRGARVVVDSGLNGPGCSMTVVLNTEEAVAPDKYEGSLAVGSKLEVLRDELGVAFVEAWDVGPSEIVVLMNYPDGEEGGPV